MSSSLKETENPALPAATPVAVSSTPVVKSAEEHTRPQPVALEIPVTVNGARTVEGSDKREPFSETTKTVLVFGHGAVVRVSSPLAAGQLVFLTNEKTKKEVVCQVVKSKSQGSTNGYVELQFTESAPGYWGMRFPGGNSAPAAVAPPRPVAPVVKPVAAPAVAALPPAPVSAVPAVATVVLPPAPEKNVVTPAQQEKAALPELVPEALPVTQAAKPIDAPSVKVLVEKIPVAKTEPLAEKSEEVPAQPVGPLHVPKIAIAENPSLDDLARQLTKELLKGSAKELPLAPKAESPKPELPQASSEELAAVLKETVKEIPVSVAAPEGARAFASNELSSEELQQKTVQLQAQLSSLLFEDASKSDSTVVTESPSLAGQTSLAERPESTQAEAMPAQPLNSRPASLLQKPLAHSIAVEEVKIPSWLAPLARETDFRSMEAISADATKAEAVADLADLKNEAAISETAVEDAPHEQQTVMYGGLMIDAASPAQTGSKKGLWIAIAAAALLVAGGVWYANQPDNLLTGVFASKPVARPKAAASDASTPFRNEVSRPAEISRTSSKTISNPPANSSAAIPNPNPDSTNSAAVVSFPASKNTVAAPSSAPSKVESAPEQPKPIFVGGHLAAPSVKLGGRPVNANDGEPAIENSTPVVAASSLNALAGGNSKGPAMPVLVGGEVKQAKLVKSVPPVYPATAKTQHVSGDVKLDALIDANGRVTSTKVIAGPVLLHQAAMEAVKLWQYDPAQLNGKATSMHLTVTVQFRLQ
jgi:TonB family protein